MAGKYLNKIAAIFKAQTASHYLVLLTVTMLCIGFGLTFVYNTALDLDLSINRRIATPENIEKEKNKVRNLKEQNAQMAEKNNVIQQRIDYFEQIQNSADGISSKSDIETILIEHLFSYRSLNGHVNVYGEGVVITLKDGDKASALIHNTDLLEVLNDLRFFGAETISVNEQPIAATSDVNCAGPIITVNGKRTAAPITIKAVGDAEALNFYLNSDESVIRILKSKGIKVNIDKSEIVFIEEKK